MPERRIKIQDFPPEKIPEEIRENPDFQAFLRASEEGSLEEGKFAVFVQGELVGYADSPEEVTDLFYTGEENISYFPTDGFISVAEIKETGADIFSLSPL